MISLTPQQPAQSPLTRLVLFMICLAVAGSFIAGAHYFTVDLPQQKTVNVPVNSEGTVTPCEISAQLCMSECISAECMTECYREYEACQ